MATQGLSDLRAVDHALVDQVLQDTAFQIGFRQGSPHDAALMESLFGQVWQEDVTRYSDGRTSSRLVERPRVAAEEWENGLDRGDAWLRVAPVDRGWRQERVRVALPKVVQPLPPSIPYVSHQPRLVAANSDNDVVVPANPSTPPRAPSGLKAADLTGTGGIDNQPVKSAVDVALTPEQRFLEDTEAAAAFWARIKQHGPHRRYWEGPRDRKGYGRVRWKGR